jgi:protein phosphatase PTC7
MEVASPSETVKFEDFIESLYPKQRVVPRPSIIEIVSSSLSNCVDFWIHHLSEVLGNLLYREERLNLKSSSATSTLFSSQQSFEKNLNSKSCIKQELAPSGFPESSSCYSLRSHAKCLPHPEKIQTGGEDAHFFTANSCGVFDGVGGWATIGVYDAAAFANGLMSETKTLALSSETDEAHFNPQTALEAAFDKVTTSGIGGSSTALVYTVNPNTGNLKASLIGDSIFIVIRRKHIVYRVPTQQHYFNCPYQLGKESDKPSDAWQFDFQLEEGDIIVSASDGFWDNFFEEDILKSLWVYEWTGPTRRVETFSRYLAERAYESSLRRDSITPFSLASKMSGLDFRGGKVDDISVIVSEVILQ